jgi:hypothetical protein
MSIIGTVAIFCGRAINSKRNAVAGFPLRREVVAAVGIAAEHAPRGDTTNVKPAFGVAGIECLRERLAERRIPIAFEGEEAPIIAWTSGDPLPPGGVEWTFRDVAALSLD